MAPAMFLAAAGLCSALLTGALSCTSPTDASSRKISTGDPATRPGTVTDLVVESVTDTSATLTFTEVGDGTGSPADYEIRYALSPIGWGSASQVEEGTCTVPFQGTSIGADRTCTVTGLTASATYDFQMVAFRGTLDVDAVFGKRSNVATGTTASISPNPLGCAAPQPEWIWCDDFEEDRLASYFEYEDRDGSFVRAEGAGTDGSTGMRVRWATGQVDAGFLHLAFGKTPQSYFDPVDEGTTRYRDVYWRLYVRNAPDWTGGGADKLSRATSFASSSSWAQAMIAHVWSGNSPDEDYLVIDPASGTDEAGNLQTTTYNDFENLRWLGAERGGTPLFAADHVGPWYCVEARARLNDPGQANGVFELWIDGELEARRTGLNWVGSFDEYGINAVFVENYWNDGAPGPRERYLDDFVVSTDPIGCGDGGSSEPNPVSAVTDLSVMSVTDTSATLRFTEVDDGTGEPADYEVRYAPSPISWGSASQVEQGTCTVPLQGTSIGADRTCTVTGLTASATYDFQMVAFRGTLDVDAVFGELSNVATGTIAAAEPAPVASVEVSPGADTVEVGGTTQLTAILKDADGNVLDGRDVSWSSSDELLATVDGAGLVTGLLAGEVTITATSEGVRGSATVTVVEASVDNPLHPNEPLGHLRVMEHTFAGLPPAGPPRECSGLGILDGCWFLYDPSSHYSIVPVADAPESSTGVLQVRYPAGLEPGSGLGLVQGGDAASELLSGEYSSLYESAWVRVPTSGFEMQRVGVKFLGYIGVAQKDQGGVSNQVYFFSDCGSGPCDDATVKPDANLAVIQQGHIHRRLNQNVTSGRVFTFGEWHHVEYVMTLNDIGVANGTLKVWVDGRLIHDHSDIMWRDAANPSGFHARHFDPVWGGMGGSAKSRDDFLQIDHLYISGVPMS